MANIAVIRTNSPETYLREVATCSKKYISKKLTKLEKATTRRKRTTCLFFQYNVSDCITDAKAKLPVKEITLTKSRTDSTIAQNYFKT